MLHLLLSMAAATATSGPARQTLVHGWDCISCENNSMLVSNVGTWRQDLTFDDPWWINNLADSHAAVFLNTFFDKSYNGTGDDNKVKVARALKKRNPKVKTFFYQPADRLGDTVYVQKVLNANPKWWLRDDSGNPIPFSGSVAKHSAMYRIDPSVPAARAFFANLSISLFHDRSEAVQLCDGVFVDGVGGPPHFPNVSDARFAAMVAGGQEMLDEMRRNLRALNGGQVIGNPVLGYNSPEGSPASLWSTLMNNTDGGFDEMFGSFLTMEAYPSGASSAWDVERMRWSMESIINASSAGKTIVIHAFPGPAGALVDGGPLFPVRGNQSNPIPYLRNDFHVAQWGGAERVPEDADACRQASAARLVESLAPFLIVANENVFFGYGWFYNLEDGYIPCPPHIECGMPNEWFPEYSKPLGNPEGPATTDATKTVWQRRFAHASVYVDLRNRSASSIAWD